MKLLCAVVLFFAVSTFANATPSDQCCQLSSSCEILVSQLEKQALPFFLAQGKPPRPGCTWECKGDRQKCTPGPCKRVGQEMVCEKENCVTIQECHWAC